MRSDLNSYREVPEFAGIEYDTHPFARLRKLSGRVLLSGAFLLVATTAATALSLSVGGISASIGGNGSGGLGVGASVGGSGGVNAGASIGGGSGASVGASVGGSSGVSAGASVGGGSGASVGASVGGSGGVSASASLGGGSGASVGASVGGTGGVSVGASLGSGGISAGVSVGGSSENVGGSTGGQVGGGQAGGGQTGGGQAGGGTTGGINSPGGNALQGVTEPTRGQYLAARNQICGIFGNSDAFVGRVLFSKEGLPIGVIHATWLTPQLKPRKITFVPLKSVSRTRLCVTILAHSVETGANGLRLPVTEQDMASMLTAYTNQRMAAAGGA
ncbi:hypothetical protein [Solirhodobacter olei]|uniref:hypothetical protein n=1 Tax=Solirhodobacter olei TaxID=2493082 RepID=UPI0019D43708|nr:hypothetical protein [Solirhodobacter olei]